MPTGLDRVPRLSVENHDRDVSAMRYVYPVVSRRARGVSVGVNLNPNNACNWRCVYCQVPNLAYGKGPPIDLELLERELRETLGAIVHGDFLERSAPEGARRLNDVAFSGNGEPTTSPHFAQAVGVVQRVLDDLGLAEVKTVLITNGSRIDRPGVGAALGALARTRGEVWFKLDSATATALGGSTRATAPSPPRSNGCAWRRACVRLGCRPAGSRHGVEPSAEERTAFVALLSEVVARGAPLAGIHLYTLARPSLQPEGKHLAPLSRAWLEAFAQSLETTGLRVIASG
ncbi:MAG: radical SAM protein [Candidatus Eisenbacteria bacterium]